MARLPISLGRLASRSTPHCERGASAVEFALLAPVVFMLIFGTFSGGIAYGQKNSITHAAREGVRYGATQPTDKTSITNSWFDSIASRVVAAANGDLDGGVPGRYLCVGYVGFRTTQGSSQDWTRKRTQSGAAPAAYTAGSISDPTTWCFDDGLGTDGRERRVQVVAERDTELNVVFWRMSITLHAQAVARYEAVYPAA